MPIFLQDLKLEYILSWYIMADYNNLFLFVYSVFLPTKCQHAFCIDKAILQYHIELQGKLPMQLGLCDEM